MVHEVYLIIRLEVSISNKWDTVVHNLCRDTDRLCLRVEELLYIYIRIDPKVHRVSH